jgi:hypothetical protein
VTDNQSKSPSLDPTGSFQFAAPDGSRLLLRE